MVGLGCSETGTDRPRRGRPVRFGSVRFAGKQRLESLDSLGHDPSDRIKAMELAQHYGAKLHTGVFYRDPNPSPTYSDYVKARQAEVTGTLSRERILDMFVPKA